MEFLPASVFIKNRYKLKELLLPASLVIVSSAKAMPRSADQFYPYRQSADMYYLTGIKQEQCTLVIYPCEGPSCYKEILYIPEPDEKTTRWEGARLSTTEASQISGVEEVRFSKEITYDIRKFLTDCTYIYFSSSEKIAADVIASAESDFHNDLSGILNQKEQHDLSPILTKLRSIKEPEEIEMIRKAVDITAAAFNRTLKEMRPGIMEYEIAAYLNFEFQIRGAKEYAFEPIVASGKNGLILHYVDNSSSCKDGDLALLDFGADWQYYSADISRTLPVNGRFTKRQRALYDANLRLMQGAIELMQPGKLLKDLNAEVGLLWQEEHIKLGLYTSGDIKKQSDRWPMWQRYYWHGTSHSIGIDVHDRFDQSSPLAPGMIMSCEPGIYIPEEGIGIRLENDILISEKGPVNLSEHIPIEADLIEDLMNRG